MSSSRTQPSSSSSSSFSLWQLQYMKLQFFTRIRSLLKSKASSCKRNLQASPEKPRTQLDSDMVAAPPEVVVLKPPEDENEEVVLQKTVKKLHFGSWEEKEKAAIEIEKLAREDKKTRKLMAELGVIQVLVSMIASEVASHQRAAVKALVQLSHGTYT